MNDEGRKMGFDVVADFVEEMILLLPIFRYIYIDGSDSLLLIILTLMRQPF